MPKDDSEFRLFMRKILPYAEPTKGSATEEHFADPVKSAAQDLCTAIDAYASSTDPDARMSLHRSAATFLRVFIARSGTPAARAMPECIRFFTRSTEPSQALHNKAKAILHEARCFPRAPSHPASSRRPKQAHIA